MEGSLEVLSQLLTVANILFCLAIAGLVQIQRKFFEWVLDKINWFVADVWPKPKTAWPKLNETKLWKIMVTAGPLGTGMLMALILDSYPYPEMFSSGDARVVFGLGCGLLSGLVWAAVQKNFGQYFKNFASKIDPNSAE